MIMNASKSRRKKKRSRAPLKPTTNNSSRGKPEDEGWDRSVCLLTEALEDVSLEEADVDVNKTVEIFAKLSDKSEDPSTTSSVFGGSSCLDSGSTSGSSVGYVETRCVQNMFKKGASRRKRVVAVTGTVANVLGKEYVRANSRKAAKYKKIVDGQNGMDEQEVEQFLYSMLGEDSELSMAVVKDVLGQCGYNVGKALEALLDLSASSNEQYGNCTEDFNLKEDARFGVGSSDNLTEVSDCTSPSSKNDLYDNIWSIGFDCRNYSKVLSSEVSSKPSGQFDLPQKVLESLFNISKSPEHEPNSMNWRNVVKKLQSVGPRFDVCPSGIAESHQELCAKGDEYQVYRKDANLWWDSMKSSYQKATAAYSKGDWQYAAYLSDQGKSQTKLARRADDKATQDIFKVRNRYIENVITIDLHGQHVKPAMKLLKLHLLLGSYVQCN
ncbi:SMR domain-containing protein At5g58720-like isoform X2 [Mangifera indica]|uniref:SMR domain-containing protein At5g58720-like isoform X2 n=1 Tax=Mangifera indica TaxID=29780 RepID=UPI001CF9871E|nr:SMR domain-containing protein At5g58720-like isoform X2 [Mangifera indica]